MLQTRPTSDPIVATRRIAATFVQRSNTRGFAAIALDWSLIIGATAIWSSLLASNAVFAWLSYPVLALINASRFRALENLVHEASHGNLFATLSWNKDLQFLFATPALRVVEDYRDSHLDHHHELGVQNVDPDLIRYARLGITRFPSQRTWIYFIRPLLGYHIVEYLQTTFADFLKSSSGRIERSAFWCTALAVVAATDAWTILLFAFIVPFFVILPCLRFWAEAAKHSALDLNHPIASARNNIGWFHRWFLHPHNDGFHCVHHLLPTISWYNLPRAFRALMKDPYFRESAVISHSMMDTFAQMGKETIKLKTTQGTSKTIVRADRVPHVRQTMLQPSSTSFTDKGF